MSTFKLSPFSATCHVILFCLLAVPLANIHYLPQCRQGRGSILSTTHAIHISRWPSVGEARCLCASYALHGLESAKQLLPKLYILNSAFLQSKSIHLLLALRLVQPLWLSVLLLPSLSPPNVLFLPQSFIRTRWGWGDIYWSADSFRFIKRSFTGQS